MRAGSVPTIAVSNLSGVSGGSGGSTRSPTRVTPSTAVPVCMPHVAVIVVLPPRGSTVAVAAVKLPKSGSMPSVHFDVMSILPDAARP
jgi:hypothetical protein